MAKVGFKGFYKLVEELCEASATGVKMQGKVLENGTDVEIAELEALFLKELGDVEAALRYARRKMSKTQRQVMDAQRREKVERHRKRKLPGVVQREDLK